MLCSKAMPKIFPTRPVGMTQNVHGVLTKNNFSVKIFTRLFSGTYIKKPLVVGGSFSLNSCTFAPRVEGHMYSGIQGHKNMEKKAMDDERKELAAAALGGLMDAATKNRSGDFDDPVNIAWGFLTANYFNERLRAFTLRWWRDEFYLWTDGVYRPLADSELAVIITQHLQAMRDFGQVGYSTRLRNEIIECLKGIVRIPAEVELDSWMHDDLRGSAIVADNGIIDVDCAGEENHPHVSEHDPRYFTFSRVKWRYKPEAQCPLWLSFLNDIMDSDAERILLLQQWAGYLLSRNLAYHKFLLCVGQGANGKGVFFSIMERLVGEENCSHVPLAAFGNRFALGSTLGKALNTSSESSEQLEKHAEALLRAYTAGDRMDFERKFKEPVRAVPTAKIMLSTNEPPRFSDRSQGVWRRMLYVPFERVIEPGRQDKMLYCKLAIEMPGIFNWAYAGLRLLCKGGFVEPSKCRESLLSYKAELNPAATFLRENYAAALSTSSIACRKVYETYKRWCSLHGNCALSDTNFGREVFKIFPDVQKQRIGQRGNRVNSYVGLAIDADAEIEDREFWND
jgi:P4 family phage/plasmid primase-like protien